MSFFTVIRKNLAQQSLLFSYTTEFRTIAELLPGELKDISTACDARQREFATGRWCARKLLSPMGIRRHEIKRGNNGEAIWPKGTCGSITHTKGACCVVAALQTDFLSVGIDIENASRAISPPAQRMFLNKDESDWINKQHFFSQNIPLAIFSIKESIYKMLFPLVKRTIPFSAVSVLPLNDDARFTCHVNVDLNETILQGRLLEGWHFQDQQWMLTVAAMK
jgi:4'-phosphopantetheinyl transferase EntD